MKHVGIFKRTFFILRDRRILVHPARYADGAVHLSRLRHYQRDRNARIAIPDQSKERWAKKITQRLVASGYFLIDENLQEVAQIEQHFPAGKTKMTMSFPFEPKHAPQSAPQIQLIADATDPNTATTLINYAFTIIY